MRTFVLVEPHGLSLFRRSSQFGYGGREGTLLPHSTKACRILPMTRVSVRKAMT